jgi:hypothetical protein
MIFVHDPRSGAIVARVAKRVEHFNHLVRGRAVRAQVFIVVFGERKRRALRLLGKGEELIDVNHCESVFSPGCAQPVETKPKFSVMESMAPPVVDYARQDRLTEMLDKSPFNMFNLVAIVVIAIAAFFLYKRYMDKQATAKAHMLRPSSIIAQPEAAPVLTPQVDEVKEE